MPRCAFDAAAAEVIRLTEGLRIVARLPDRYGYTHGSTLHNVGLGSAYAGRVLAGEDPHAALKLGGRFPPAPRRPRPASGDDRDEPGGDAR